MYLSKLPAETLKEIKNTLNAPENLRIIPTELHAKVVISYT